MPTDRMGNPLTPLSEKDALEFANSRHSRAVVQHRCSNCGTWYETPRQAEPFQETFSCDCGARIEFTVPPLDLNSAILHPTNAEVLLALDTEARLDTGMRVKEAMSRAEKWWDAKGRKMIRREARRGKAMAFSSLDPNSENYMGSGLIDGLHWAALGKREKLLLVKVWHHFFIRKPDMIGGADAEVKLNGKLGVN